MLGVGGRLRRVSRGIWGTTISTGAVGQARSINGAIEQRRIGAAGLGSRGSGRDELLRLVAAGSATQAAS